MFKNVFSCLQTKHCAPNTSGAILKIYPNNAVEEYLLTDHWITGMQFDKNGDFWIGFTTKLNDQLDNIHPKVGMYGLPSFIQPKPEKFGMVIEVSVEGEILQTLFDPKGNIVTEAGAVLEHKGYLYLGGDIVSYISKSKLYNDFHNRN